MPVTFIYGDHDWMDQVVSGSAAGTGAESVVVALKAAGGQAATPGDLRVFVTPDSGHYTFLDQPEDFLRHMMTTLQPYVDASAKVGALR